MNRFIAIVLLVLFGLTFFTSLASASFPFLSYVDELLSIFIFGVVLVGGRVKRAHFRILTLLSVFWVYVFLNSAFSPYYRGIFMTALDLCLFSKPILIYIGLMNIPGDVINKTGRRLLPVMYFYLLLGFILYFVNIFIPMFPVGDMRFGINSYSFISNNPGEFANLVFAAGIFVYSLSHRSGVLFFSIWLMTFLSLASLRSKAIVLTAIYLLMIAARRIGLTRWTTVNISGTHAIRYPRIKTSTLLVILPVGLALGANQFIKYFLSEMTPRLYLITNSLTVAKQFFPFGAGAGTYGSAVSKIQYSKLYYDLGFAGWGLSETDGRFLSDNFWPMVLAQYGVIGMVVIITIYIMIVRNLVQCWPTDYRRRVGAFMILANLILSTLGSAVIIGYIGTILIFVLVFLLRKA